MLAGKINVSFFATQALCRNLSADERLVIFVKYNILLFCFAFFPPFSYGKAVVLHAFGCVVLK